MIYNNILETIGNTPMVRLNKIEDSKAQNLWVKLESFNPGGSVKDRPALNMILEAEKKGVLKQGDTIIEPTSGNTGIGLAMVAATKGYKAIFTMPETMTVERRKILQAYGAEIVLTPGAEGMMGAINEAKRLVKEHGYFMPMQFENYDNVEAHKSTASEIWNDSQGRIDVLVCATGTGGTVTGTGKYLREKNPKIKVIAIEPADSPVLSGGKPGVHKIPGMGPGFVPGILDKELFDEIVAITTEQAYEMTKFLASQEGIFVGISSGAVVWAMVELAKQDKYAGKHFCAVLPDTGERYLSSEVWE